MIINEVIKWVLIIYTIIWLGSMQVFYISEKKRFNNGKCKCGGGWKYFDTDSRGELSFRCDKCGRVIWNSWYRKMGDNNDNR